MLDRLETKYAATAGVAPALTSLPGGSTAVGGDLMVEQPSKGSQVTGEMFVRRVSVLFIGTQFSNLYTA